MHTVIYMLGQTDTSSTLRANERGMTKEPIAVKPSRPDSRLNPMSRLNFGKVYTVEHNIKAMDVGMVVKESMMHLKTYFSEVCPRSQITT